MSKSSEIVKYKGSEKKISNVANQLTLLESNFNLNKQPVNFMRRRSILEENLFNAANEAHRPTVSSFSLANGYLEKVGEVDVISPSSNIKSLLKMGFSRDIQVSIFVNHIGNSLLLDEFDMSYFLCQQEWDWLRKFVAEEKLTVARRSHTRDVLRGKYLFSKLLYHSALEGPSAHPAPAPTNVDVQCVSSSPKHAAAASSQDPALKRALLWQLEDLHMLVGTDLAVFGGPQHPCISLRLAEAGRPISVLTGIDYWLDNLMNDVPEVAMYYHSDGLIQNYEILATDELPEISGFNPKSVTDAARNLLLFLRNRAAEEGHTYWLFKAPDSEYVKLYDLTKLCESLGQANPFSAPVGLLCLRVAQKRWRNVRGDSCVVNPTRKETSDLLKLLHHAKALLDPVEQTADLVDAYNLYSEVILHGRLFWRSSQENVPFFSSAATPQHEDDNVTRKTTTMPRHHLPPHRRRYSKSSQMQQPTANSTSLIRSSSTELELSCRPAIISLNELHQKLPMHAATTSSFVDKFAVDDTEGSSTSSSTDDEYAPPEDDELAAQLSVRSALQGFTFLSSKPRAARACSSYHADRDRMPISNPLVPIPMSYERLNTVSTSSVGVGVGVEGDALVPIKATASFDHVRANLLRNAAHAHFILAEANRRHAAIESLKQHSSASLLARRRQRVSRCHDFLQQALSNIRLALHLLILSTAEQSVQEDVDFRTQVVEKGGDILMMMYYESNHTSLVESEKVGVDDNAEKEENSYCGTEDAVSADSGSLVEQSSTMEEAWLEALGTSTIRIDTAAPLSASERFLLNEAQHANPTELHFLNQAVNCFSTSSCEQRAPTAGTGSSVVERRIAERKAAALNEWARRILEEARIDLRSNHTEEYWKASTWATTWEKSLQVAASRIDAAAQLLDSTDDKLRNKSLVFANRAVLYRVLLSGRYIEPRRWILSSNSNIEVTWAEQKLYKQVDEMYATALFILRPSASQSRWYPAASTMLHNANSSINVQEIFWENRARTIAWDRLQAHLDCVEVFSSYQIEGMNENERFRECLRQHKHTLNLCSAEGISLEHLVDDDDADSASSCITQHEYWPGWVYQAGQAHRHVADLLVRQQLVLPTASTTTVTPACAKRLEEARTLWIEHYSGAHRLLEMVHGEAEFRNAAVHLELLLKIVRFSCDAQSSSSSATDSLKEMTLLLHKMLRGAECFKFASEDVALARCDSQEALSVVMDTFYRQLCELFKSVVFLDTSMQQACYKNAFKLLLVDWPPPLSDLAQRLGDAAKLLKRIQTQLNQM